MCQICSVQRCALPGAFERQVPREGMVHVCRSVGCQVFGRKPKCFGMSDKEIGFSISLVMKLSVQLLMGCSHWCGTAPGGWHSCFWDPHFGKSQSARLASSTAFS